jgi:hypothetical protein
VILTLTTQQFLNTPHPAMEETTTIQVLKLLLTVLMNTDILMDHLSAMIGVALKTSSTVQNLSNMTMTVFMNYHLSLKEKSFMVITMDSLRLVA